MISSIDSMNSMTAMREMRQQMFSKIDTNSDGKHGADELSAMVANGPQGGPGVEDILTQFDTDGDGALSESEFNAAQSGPPGGMSGVTAMSTEDFISQLFSQADENEDGVIDEDELAQMAAMGPKDGPDAKDILSRLHTNGDGTINETEFTTAMNTVESILSSASGDESDASISDLMEMLGAALNAYQQASSTSYTSYTQASQTTGSSFYA